MGRLDGKVALITGAARGQGAAEARLFVAEGATVVLTDILDDEGRRVAADIGRAASYLHHDVTREEDWERVVGEVTAAHHRLDVLVNNAGVFRVLPMALTSTEEYLDVVRVNQLGVFLGMRAVTATMAGANRGSIVNVSSVAGMQGSPATVAYTATKWAVRGMTKVAALELAPFGVRVNSVHPGLIDTPMLAEITQYGDAAMQEAVKRVPMGRLAGPGDVAPLVLFLASDESSYATGAEFVVDGGLSAG